eukprot:2956_1
MTQIKYDKKYNSATNSNTNTRNHSRSTTKTDNTLSDKKRCIAMTIDGIPAHPVKPTSTSSPSPPRSPSIHDIEVEHEHHKKGENKNDDDLKKNVIPFEPYTPEPEYTRSMHSNPNQRVLNIQIIYPDGTTSDGQDDHIYLAPDSTKDLVNAINKMGLLVTIIAISSFVSRLALFFIEIDELN